MNYVYVIKIRQLSRDTKTKQKFDLCMSLIFDRDKNLSFSYTHFLPIFLSKETAELEASVTKQMYADNMAFENINYQMHIERVTVEEACKLASEHLKNHYVDDTENIDDSFFA